jgi:hypothetical protein
MLAPPRNRLVLDPVKVAIARLSDDEIVRMDSSDLFDVLRMAEGLRSIGHVRRAIRNASDDVLVDLVIASRDRCRTILQRRLPMLGTQGAA